MIKIAKKFILVIGIMIISVTIMMCLHYMIQTNNVLENDYMDTNNESVEYEIKVNGESDWILDIYSEMRRDNKTFNGIGQKQ